MQLYTKSEQFFLSKKVRTILVLLFLVAVIPVTLFASKMQQDIRQRAESSCQTDNNLIQNCDMSQVVNGFPLGWLDGRIEPNREPRPDEQDRERLHLTTVNGENAISIGQEQNTCSIESEGFRLFPEVRQYINVGSATNYQLSFDFQIRSRHQAPYGSGFYVFGTFVPRADRNNPGKELFIAYTPHNEDSDSFCSAPIQPDYHCQIGIVGFNKTGPVNCNQAFNSWKHITIDFNRDILCKDGDTIVSDCVNLNDTLYIGFGVENDFDTVVLLRNVKFTADGVLPTQPTQPPIQNTATPFLSPTAPVTSPSLPQGITPSPSPIVTLPPTSSHIQFQVNLTLSGIGERASGAQNVSNPNPTHTTRTMQLEFYKNGGDVVATQTGTITFDQTTNSFKGILTTNQPLTPGSYTVKAKVPGYLTRLLPGVLLITSQTTSYILPQATLIPGDINTLTKNGAQIVGDNTVNLLDYNVFIACYTNPNSTACGTNKDLADFNDDGRVNSDDLLILTRSFEIRNGD